jgi:hypothetical protein
MAVEMTHSDIHAVTAASLRTAPSPSALIGRMSANEQDQRWGPPIWLAEKPTVHLASTTGAGWMMLGIAFSRR